MRIKDVVPLTEILAGLSEECGELIQAALKLRRVFVSENPTPISEEQAIENLHEEIADVMLYINQIDVNRNYIDEIMKKKEERWEGRLGIK